MVFIMLNTHLSGVVDGGRSREIIEINRARRAKIIPAAALTLVLKLNLLTFTVCTRSWFIGNQNA